MNEMDFTNALAASLVRYLVGLEVATRKSLLYALSVDEDGRIQLGVDYKGEPLRGGGTGFEQDVLVFEKAETGATSVIPRVAAEVKFSSVTTHDAITYSEKARRIRTVYPFVRYGLILGQMSSIPRRVLRLGQEFDFILVVSQPATPAEIEALGRPRSADLPEDGVSLLRA